MIWTPREDVAASTEATRGREISWPLSSFSPFSLQCFLLAESIWRLDEKRAWKDNLQGSVSMCYKARTPPKGREYIQGYTGPGYKQVLILGKNTVACISYYYISSWVRARSRLNHILKSAAFRQMWRCLCSGWAKAGDHLQSSILVSSRPGLILHTTVTSCKSQTRENSSMRSLSWPWSYFVGKCIGG